MSFTISDTVDCDLLPGDGAAAEQRFLALVSSGEELWIIAYGFTLPAMIADLLAAHKAGTAVHLYLDHTQSAGATEAPLVKELVDAGLEVTIGTSTDGKRYICHDKALVTRSGKCFVGSCNFSASGWHQVNAIFEFADVNYARALVDQFNQLVAYAWGNEANLQLMSAQPTAVHIT